MYTKVDEANKIFWLLFQGIANNFQTFHFVQNEDYSLRESFFDFTKYRPWNIKKNAYSQWKNSYIILVIVNKKISNHNCDHIRLYTADTYLSKIPIFKF